MNAYDPPKITLTAEATITRGDRIKHGSGAFGGDVAGAGESCFAVAEEDAASGDNFTAALVCPGFIYTVRALAAFAVNAELFAVAAGEVDDSGSGGERWTALEAAGAANALVKAIPRWVGDIDAT